MTSLTAGVMVQAQNAEESSEPLYKVTFHTHPSPAQVYMDVSGRHTYEKFLGESGRPILVDLSQLQGASGFDVIIRHEGYFDKKERISSGYFNTRDRYPEQGAVRLEPENWLVSVKYTLRRYRSQTGLGLVALLALVYYAGRRRRRTRLALNRAALLDDLRAKAGGQDPNVMATLGNWRIVERLGHGANAAVYRAVPDRDLEKGESVAIKLFTEEASDSEEFLERFHREARLCRDLDHHAIVRLLDWGSQDGLFYLVMEYVDGESLRETINPRGLPAEQVLEILLKVGEALTHAHAQGIVHRDVKPENIMVTSRGQVKLMDFGLAREVVSSFTKTGRALGTPAYMSPEQVQGKFVDQRCDQYALGIVGYELLAGSPPFRSRETDPAPILFQQVNQVPEPLHKVCPEVPQELSEVIMKMLAKEPSDRYPDMRTVLLALKDLADGPD